MTSQSEPTHSIKFGLFDWIERDQHQAADTMENRLKLLGFADQHGFFCYHLAEHHTTPLSVAPSPGIFLAAAAQRTSRIRLGPLVYLLPMYNPLRLVQEVCMLDHLSRGRLELGVGRGIVPYEVERFGIDPADAPAMFEEALHVLLKGLTQGTLDHQGKFYNYDNVRLWVQPYQQPHPPIWYASGNIETVPWLARNGIHTSHIFDTNEATKRHFDQYKEIWGSHRAGPDRINQGGGEPLMGQTRHIYIAPTDEEAVRDAREAWSAWFNNINYLWAEFGAAQLERMRDFDGLRSQDIVIAGSPKTVREKVWQAIEESGINYFIGIFAWGNIPHENALRSMHYFADEVIPQG